MMLRSEYAAEYLSAVKRGDTEKAEELRARMLAEAHAFIEVASARVDTIRAEFKTGETTKQRQYKKQYNELLTLYRSSMRLAKEISELKKAMREGKQEREVQE